MPRFRDEVLNELVKAWWRGDFVAAGGVKRVDVLRALYRLYSNCIVFDIPDSPSRLEITELPDGGAEVVIYRVPLPNSNPDYWDDLNCAEAFNAVAEFWDCESFPLVKPTIGGLEATEKEFTRWIEAEKKPRPMFWAPGDEEGPPSPTKRVSERTANKLAGDYIRAAKEEARNPTQREFMIKTEPEGFVGAREILRKAYRNQAKLNDISLSRGPRKRPR
jgi:hypothetical protein